MEAAQPVFIGDERNKEISTYMSRDSNLIDFYTKYDPLEITPNDSKEFARYIKKLDEDEKKLLESRNQYYQVDLKCIGGLVMPVILEFVFIDGTKEDVRIPAEIWRTNHEQVSKVFAFDKEVISITLDPWLETADVDLSNNHWPPRVLPSKFELYKGGNSRYGNKMKKDNPMQQQKRLEEKDKGQQLQKEEK